MKLPDEPDRLQVHLVERAQAHFEGADETLLREAAKMLIEDREKAKKENLFPLPGQAEYLDLLRAVLHSPPEDGLSQIGMLEELRDFTLRKGAS